MYRSPSHTHQSTLYRSTSGWPHIIINFWTLLLIIVSNSLPMILKLCVSLSQVRILLPDCWKNLSLVSTKVQSITYAHNCYEILAVEPWGTCVSKSLPFNPGVFDSFPYPPWRTIAVHVGVGHFSVCPLAHSMLCLSFLLFSLEFYFSFSLPLPPFPSSLHCQTEMGET